MTFKENRERHIAARIAASKLSHVVEAAFNPSKDLYNKGTTSALLDREANRAPSSTVDEISEGEWIKYWIRNMNGNGR
jgi:hypothetical protein